MVQRSILEYVIADLQKKMVFVSGPRQVGKTTLAKQILEKLSPAQQLYFNWDRPEHRKTIRGLLWSRGAGVVALDEIHKYHRWKTLLKGFFDTEGKDQRLLVTGSARLDLYKKGGESLVGRYFGYRLHPLSLGEIAREGKAPSLDPLLNPSLWPQAGSHLKNDAMERLLLLGGFPEPFLRGEEEFSRRWRLAREDLILKQDLRDLTMVRHVSLVEELLELLKERVGSPISINNLREDLQVDHATVAAWLDILERLYLVFRVQPYSGKLARTLRKEGKIYFWDWASINSEGPRFENFIAGHLLKLCHWLNDVHGYKMDLRYVRDREKREVDFLVIKDGKPWILIEAKVSRQDRWGPLNYFKERLNVPHAFAINAQGAAGKDIWPAAQILTALP